MTTACKLMYDALSSGIRLIWPSPETRPFGKEKEKKPHKKSTRSQPPPPPFPQIKCVFQGRNNSGSSPTTLCAQLSQRITWFIYSLECCNRMIELLFIYLFFFIRSVWCIWSGLWSRQRYDEHDGVWQLRSKSPVCCEKCRCSTFLNGDAYWFLIFKVRQEQARTSSPFGTDIVICSQRNLMNHLWSS